MDVHEYRFLLSERAALRDLIDRAPPGSVITKMSFENRLRQVEEQLESFGGCSPRVVNARLTFRGKPIMGSRGIDAEFGSDAAKLFANAVRTVGASNYAPLSSRGPVPHGEDYRLLITNMARGSFGFQFEQASQQLPLAGESTPVELAIAQFKGILEASVGTDEQLAEAIIETDQRALGEIRKFLKIVADSDAVCALEFCGDQFKFIDVDQVRRSESRLSEDNIREDDVTLTGYFEGFLPISRRAEFHITQANADFLNEAIGTVISGKVESDVDEAIRDINEILKRVVRVDAHTRRVGDGRPRYVISNCEQLTS